MRISISLYLLFTSIIFIHAKLPTDFQSEQVYLCPQTLEIPAGDSIDVKGFVACLSVADNKPYSNYIYVELINGNDSLLIRQKVSCKNNGFFYTRLATDPLGEPGIYYLRAYTRLMLNFSNESLAIQPLLIGCKFSKHELTIDNEVNCTVIPFGGALAPGVVQSLTAYLTDDIGNSLANKTLYLLSAQSDTISSCLTSPSGFALFRFVPQQGETYHISFADKDIHKDFPVTTVTGNHPKIQASLIGNKLRYEVLNITDKRKNSFRLYAYDRFNGVQIIEASQWYGIVQLHKAPTMETLFLTDSANNIVSECTVLSMTHNTRPISIVNDTVRVGDIINVSLPASVNASDCRVLMRIAPDTERWSPHAESALLYLSDYSSPIDFPSCYFDYANDRRNEELAAWIGTVRFKRFNLKEAILKGTTIYDCLPEMVLSFEGWAENEFKRPFKGGSIVVYNTENNLVYNTSINNDGHFHIAVDDFANGNEFFLQALNNNGRPVMATIHINDDVFPKIDIARHYNLKQSRYDSGNEVGIDSGDIRRFLLPNVTIKARLRHPKISPTNKFYSTNYANREKIDKHNYMTLLDILKDMPGVIFGNNLGTYQEKFKGYTIPLTSNRGHSTLGSRSLPIIVDGTKIPDDMLLNLLEMSAFEIEEVELLRPWQAISYAQGCIDGAILVKTRKTTYQKELPTKGTFYTPMGLTPSIPVAPHTLRAEHKGNYRLLVDVISSDFVHSYEHSVVIVP